jgi:hypothetical protein
VGTCDIAVHSNLLELQEKLPDLFEEMKDHLSKIPFMGIKGKYFTMKQYYAWEYRFNLRNRVYLQVHPEERRVFIYGAGAHPKEKVPKPPKAENIFWSEFIVI